MGLYLDDSSRLLVTGGEIGGIDFRDNATAVLRGGQIGNIESFQRPLGGDYPPSYWDKHITIEYSGELPTLNGNVLAGLWGDGSGFSIELHNPDTTKYNSVMSNIEFVFVPEPTTILLFGFGGLGVHRFGKRKALK